MNHKTTNEKVEKNQGELTTRTDSKREMHEELLEITQSLLPAFGENWNRSSMATLTVGALSRILYLNTIYQKIVDVPGVICEFGVHWGASLAQLINLRSIYEPFNSSRVIYGFDTFEGFVGTNEKDGGFFGEGEYSTAKGYEVTLNRILELHESITPQSNIRKFDLLKGDATVTVDKWLDDNPHAIIALAFFDMDIYKPTKLVLEKIIPRLTRGSILVFDELNHQYFPGETKAVDEVLGLNNLKLKKHPLHPHGAWTVFGE